MEEKTLIADLLAKDFDEATESLVIEDDEGEALQEMIQGLQITAYERGLAMARTGDAPDKSEDAIILRLTSDEAANMLTSLIREGESTAVLTIVQ